MPKEKSKTAVANKAPARTSLIEGKTFVTAGQRSQMIADAAYFRAEKRGFSGGDEARDWLEAEAEIDALLQQQLATIE